MGRVHKDSGVFDSAYKAQVGTLAFDNKESTILLQTADTLAYEVHKDFKRTIEQPNTPERLELQKLKATHRIHKISLFDESTLNYLPQGDDEEPSE